MISTESALVLAGGGVAGIAGETGFLLGLQDDSPGLVRRGPRPSRTAQACRQRGGRDGHPEGHHLQPPTRQGTSRVRRLPPWLGRRFGHASGRSVGDWIRSVRMGFGWTARSRAMEQGQRPRKRYVRPGDE